MKTKDVCKVTGLTRKALQYYRQENLIDPEVSNNGYREFSDDDVRKLKQITIYRKFGLSISEIYELLNSTNLKQDLMTVLKSKQLELEKKEKIQDVFLQYIYNDTEEETWEKLSSIDKTTSIKEKILFAFPGYYGRYFALHFGQFLDITIDTPQQQQAYEFIIKFLDNMEPIIFDDEMKKEIEEVSKVMDDDKINTMLHVYDEVFDDFDSFYDKNKGMLQEYQDFKQTQEFKESTGNRLMKLFKETFSTNGYYDEFLPAMRRLSPLYETYYQNLLEASGKLLEKMPEIKDSTL